MRFINRLFVSHGANARKMVRELLEASEIISEIPRNGIIAIKPNLVLSKPSSSGATSDPEITDAIIEWLQENGRREIEIIESSWLGDCTRKALRECGYDEISKKRNVGIFDLKLDRTIKVKSGPHYFEVCQRPLDAAYLINVPVLKAHCQTKMTCALKNLKGCIPDSEKRRFHSLGLHEPIARLNTLLKSRLTIVDAIIGDLRFEEGGTPIRMNKIILGRDPVLVDAYSAQLLGFEPSEIGYIPIAESLNVGSANLVNARITEFGNDRNYFEIPVNRSIGSEYLNLIVQDHACSVCYANLLFALERLRETGFLKKIKQKIFIGQAFNGKSVNGFGIGKCVCGAKQFVDGCPPNARAIVSAITKCEL
ncbi:MAG: DUF362 domain-containing protein [Candidatus Riflebacteria bacterium]|nr:DUF362 domain-containing protein [Candidatus Riflebacteria bacterium]